MTLDSKADRFVETALNARALRQDIIAGNLANVDTPGYRSRDIDFESALAAEAGKAYGSASASAPLAMATTDPRHIQTRESIEAPKAKLFFRDGHLARNDGNSVDLDVESAELSKNNVMFTALVAAYKQENAIMTSVVDSNTRIS